MCICCLAREPDTDSRSSGFLTRVKARDRGADKYDQGYIAAFEDTNGSSAFVAPYLYNRMTLLNTSKSAHSATKPNSDALGTNTSSRTVALSIMVGSATSPPFTHTHKHMHTLPPIHTHTQQQR